ncbi:tetratricopeptide repeat-containing sensor histidine kinase [Christiangramia forsetii]|uniref:Oxygen sensor histidine kinase NreB n=2 Tax=Christiangramia forsetii TaxID=411153 RepID=A0M4P5_CHRFK|nr:sensor histidine kinase [Christiangramia forsetii]GGG22961.1 hypothetical protein GCM10011532_02570 [Christiangramia forsetii]CAL67590.1 two-component system sensor histidine kinase [Christiangramia forsetii KT0803]
MKKSLINIILTTGSLLLTVFSYSQSASLATIDSLLTIRETEQAYVKLKQIDSANLNKPLKAEYYNLLASAENLNNRSDRSYEYWMISRKMFRDIDSFGKVAQINLRIVQTLNSSKYAELDTEPFMDEYLQYARKQDDPHILALAHDQLAKVLIASDSLESLRQFKLALAQSKKTADSLLTAKIHHNTGVVYAEKLKEFDSAFYHYDKAFQEYEELGHNDFMSYIYNNRASVYKQQKNYEAAIENYLKADSISPREYSKENYRLRYGWLAEAYELNNDPNNSLKYLKLQNSYRDSLMNEEQHTSMLDIQTKYEVEKKENENLKLKQRSIWLFIAIGGLLLLLTIGYLAFKNLRRKKKLSEKEHEVQRQKLENLLQEQELAGIDAMIEGQEKERQRIANDLHDNLGSLLATIKLHFQNLKVKKDRLKEEEDKILKQTDDLLDEAYQEVRKIAHAKNAGVHASEGLLPAVRNFATKVSAANKLVIEVEDHGMDERLENSFEITVFRIVQELITNVIKHAEASEAIIHLTHHGEELNLMVEDNGRGFNTSEIKYQEGMGIHSIQRRVEYMGGTVDVESVEGKGTSVIINIPIK